MSSPFVAALACLQPFWPRLPQRLAEKTLSANLAGMASATVVASRRFAMDPVVRQAIVAYLANGPPYPGDSAHADKDALKGSVGGRWDNERKKWVAWSRDALRKMIHTQKWRPCCNAPRSEIVAVLDEEDAARRAREAEAAAAAAAKTKKKKQADFGNARLMCRFFSYVPNAQPVVPEEAPPAKRARWTDDENDSGRVYHALPVRKESAAELALAAIVYPPPPPPARCAICKRRVFEQFDEDPCLCAKSNL